MTEEIVLRLVTFLRDTTDVSVDAIARAVPEATWPDLVAARRVLADEVEFHRLVDRLVDP